jgi:hypothetical protein
MYLLSSLRYLLNTQSKMTLKRIQKCVASSHRYSSVNYDGFELIAADAVIAFCRVV